MKGHTSRKLLILVIILVSFPLTRLLETTMNGLETTSELTTASYYACNETEQEACVVNSDSENACTRIEEGSYICECSNPYIGIPDENKIITSCILGCDATQELACLVDGTSNKCTAASKDEFTCTCIAPYTEVKDKNDKITACTLMCNAKQEKACKANEEGSKNKCNATKLDDYICLCEVPYIEVVDANDKVTACLLTCDIEEQEACKINNTDNKCVASLDGFQCDCIDPYEGGEPSNGRITSCVMKKGDCKDLQKTKCRTEASNNTCIVPDKSLEFNYYCECGGGFEPMKDANGTVVECSETLLPECSVEQSRYCRVMTSDNSPTLNKCGQPSLDDPLQYICECKDLRYGEVKNSEGVVVNCTRKVCDVTQDESCKVEVDGQITGNRCTLPIKLKPDKHTCVCVMPYFIATGENMESICDRLAPGEYYLEEPHDQTVLEGNPVVLNCVVDRPVNECIWWRGDHKVTPSLHPNATAGRAKYILQGHACDGVCSLKISSVTLTHDNTKWICSPFLEGLEIPPASADIHVVVAPMSPWLEHSGEILEPNAVVYIKFFRAHSKRIQVKCVSKSAFPAASHKWSQDGVPVFPPPPSSLEQDIMADTFTTKSTAFFVVKRQNQTTIQCISSNDATVFETVAASFTSTAPTTRVRILFLLDEDWFEPPHGIILLEHPAETVLQCESDGRPEPQYTWQEKVDGKWQPVGFLESYIVTTHTRTLRCLAGNSENREPLASHPVTIQRKGSGDLPGPATGPPHFPTKYKFLLEPDDHVIGPGATFELGCQVNGPVHTCMWNRRDMEINQLGSLPDFAFAGHKNEGLCTIHIMGASVDSLGGWTCLPVLYDGTVMTSREAIVSGLHFSLFPEGSDDAWRYRPQLTINGRIVNPGTLVVLNEKDSSLTWLDVVADCSAYSRTDAGEMEWKLGDIAYRKFPSSRLPIPSDPQVFLISSKVDFILNAVLKTSDMPHSILMELGCKVVGRKKIAFVAGDWTYLISNEIKVTLTLEHPTLDVVVVPHGPITLGTPAVVLLLCSCNGFPFPRHQWQEYKENWEDIPNAVEPSLRISKVGKFRCTAGNEHNINGFQSSQLVEVRGADELKFGHSSSAVGFNLTAGVMLWSLLTVIMTLS